MSAFFDLCLRIVADRQAPLARRSAALTAAIALEYERLISARLK